MFGHDKHTSERISNLSFIWSIQTLLPDPRKCVANTVEGCDIGDMESVRMNVSRWDHVHVDNGDCASEI